MINLIYGNKKLQWFWRIMLRISLKGLNHNRGHEPNANGEIFAVNYVIKTLKKKDIVIFDVGANKGQYLAMTLKQIPSSVNATIHCFEPQLDAFKKMEEVAAGHSNVKTNHFALGSSEGELTLYKHTEQSEYSSLYQADYFQHNIKLSTQELIKIKTLDDYCNTNAIEAVDFLKIDVEGHELEVLKGAKSFIEKGKIKFIQFEFGMASIEARIFFKDFVLMLKDYDIYRILPNNLELIHYSEYCELFFVTNYLAIRK